LRLSPRTRPPFRPPPAPGKSHPRLPPLSPRSMVLALPLRSFFFRHNLIFFFLSQVPFHTFLSTVPIARNTLSPQELFFPQFRRHRINPPPSLPPAILQVSPASSFSPSLVPRQRPLFFPPASPFYFLIPFTLGSTFLFFPQRLLKGKTPPSPLPPFFLISGNIFFSTLPVFNSFFPPRGPALLLCPLKFPRSPLKTFLFFFLPHPASRGDPQSSSVPPSQYIPPLPLAPKTGALPSFQLHSNYLPPELSIFFQNNLPYMHDLPAYAAPCPLHQCPIETLVLRPSFPPHPDLPRHLFPQPSHVCSYSRTPLPFPLSTSPIFSTLLSVPLLFSPIDFPSPFCPPPNLSSPVGLGLPMPYLQLPPFRQTDLTNPRCLTLRPYMHA